MSVLPPVVATLVADTKQFSGEMDKAAGKMDALGASGDLAGARMTKFANKAASAIIGVTVIGAAASLKMATDFQTAVTQLVTGAGESEKNVKMISSGILEMAGTVGQTPAELAKGLYLIESAGFHGASGLKVLKAAAEGAAVGGAQMSDVSNALTTALHDYNIPAARAGQVTSALIETVALGKTHLADLSQSMGRVMPTASALGVSFQQVTGAIATMTNSGLSARFASMHLQNTLLALSAPSKNASDAMASVGLSSQSVKNALDGPEGLQGALKLIEQHVSQTFPNGSVQSVNAFKNIMGGATGYSTALMLSGSHSKEFAKNVDQIGQRLDAVKPKVQGFALVQKDLGFQMKQLGASASSAAINVGTWLLPKATDVAKWAAGVGEYMKKHPLAGTIATDAAIGLFAAAVALKIKNAVSSVLSAGSDVWNGIKSILGKVGIGSGSQAAPIDANTAALNRLTEAMGGKGAAAGGLTGAEAGGAAGGAETGAAVAGGVPLGLLAAGTAMLLAPILMEKGYDYGKLPNGGSNYGARTRLATEPGPYGTGNAVKVTNLHDIAPAIADSFSRTKITVKPDDTPSGQRTAANTGIISGLAASQLPNLAGIKSASTSHLPAISRQTGTTADRVGTMNGHMMTLIGAVQKPNKINVTVKVG